MQVLEPDWVSRADMDLVKNQFVEATRSAIRAGFDLLELHCAHGYLLASFISPLTNVRSDEYGGSLEDRRRCRRLDDGRRQQRLDRCRGCGTRRQH